MNKKIVATLFQVILLSAFASAQETELHDLNNLTKPENRRFMDLDIRTAPNKDLFEIEIVFRSFEIDGEQKMFISINQEESFMGYKYGERTNYYSAFLPLKNGGYVLMKDLDTELVNTLYIKRSKSLELTINELNYRWINEYLSDYNTTKYSNEREVHKTLKTILETAGVDMPNNTANKNYWSKFFDKVSKREFFGRDGTESKKGYNLKLLTGDYVKRYYDYDYVGPLKNKKYPHGKGFINSIVIVPKCQGEFTFERGEMVGEGVMYSRFPYIVNPTMAKAYELHPEKYFITAGHFNGLKPHGYAELLTPTGEIYKATWDEGEVYGNVLIQEPDGNERTETFDGTMNASGSKINLSNGSYVIVEQETKMWSGSGKWVHPDFTYEGELVDLLPHGEGKYTFKGGDVAVGPSRNGALHGSVLYTFANKEYCKCEFKNGRYVSGRHYSKSGERLGKKKSSSGWSLKLPEIKIAHIEVDLEGDLKNPGRIFNNTLKETGNAISTGADVVSEVVIKPLSDIAKETTIFIDNVGKEVERGWENGTIEQVAILVASYYIAGPLVFQAVGWELAAGTILVNIGISEFFNAQNPVSETSQKAIIDAVNEADKLIEPIVNDLTGALCSLSGVPSDNCNINFLVRADYSDELLAGLGDDHRAYYQYYKETYENAVQFIEEMPIHVQTHQKLLDKAHVKLDADPNIEKLLTSATFFYNTMHFSSDLMVSGALSDSDFASISTLFNEARYDYSTVNQLFSSKNLLVDAIEDENIRAIVEQITIQADGQYYLSSLALDNYILKKQTLLQQRSPAGLVEIVMGATLIIALPVGYKLYTASRDLERYTDLKQKIGALKKSDKKNWRKYMILDRQLDKLHIDKMKDNVYGTAEAYYTAIPRAIVRTQSKHAARAMGLIYKALSGELSPENLEKKLKQFTEKELKEEYEIFSKELEKVRKEDANNNLN